MNLGIRSLFNVKGYWNPLLQLKILNRVKFLINPSSLIVNLEISIMIVVLLVVLITDSVLRFYW